ncbi:hypothetical protein V5799_016686 [Amblyomma americanum]|uniref:Uncharacterized protein n=1 Tax=Amblyomma americanum TaxID=6943 RepID=A0AAQ4F554_AMBAM
MVLRSCCCGSVVSTIIKSGALRRSLSCLSKASDLRYPRCPMIALFIFEERRIIILLPAMAALSVLDSSEWHKRKSWPRCVLCKTTVMPVFPSVTVIPAKQTFPHFALPCDFIIRCPVPKKHMQS